MSQLDAKGRCCGRKPIFYKGGSFASPLGAPLHFCSRCNREYGSDGKQRANWAYKQCKGCGMWIAGSGSSLCGECACEEETL